MDYLDESVLLLVDRQDENITMRTGKLTVEEALFVMYHLLKKVEDVTGIEYNDLLEDLKIRGEN